MPIIFSGSTFQIHRYPIETRLNMLFSPTLPVKANKIAMLKLMLAMLMLAMLMLAMLMLKLRNVNAKPC